MVRFSPFCPVPLTESFLALSPLIPEIYTTSAGRIKHQSISGWPHFGLQNPVVSDNQECGERQGLGLFPLTSALSDRGKENSAEEDYSASPRPFPLKGEED
jgi:hypothetical protein